MKIKIGLDAPASDVNPITLGVPSDPDLTARAFFDTLVTQEGSLTPDVFIPPSKVAYVIIQRDPQ